MSKELELLESINKNLEKIKDQQQMDGVVACAQRLADEINSRPTLTEEQMVQIDLDILNR
jgi:hypothetical protein